MGGEEKKSLGPKGKLNIKNSFRTQTEEELKISPYILRKLSIAAQTRCF